jgi:hypothetical protein
VLRRLTLTLPLFLLLAPAAADAKKLTLGSDLKRAASVVVGHGADTALWPDTVDGKALRMPADGQVIKVRVKGSAMSEEGASNPPATMVHFQSLLPAGANGARQIWLTSGAFDMPVDRPAAITTFEPENLCVKRGGTVVFNTIGGFRWGGSFEAPLSNHYLNGTPWRIFAGARRSSVAWYSNDNGTNNGDVVVPFGGTNAHDGMGSVYPRRELLMQLVVATGQDRSEPCGGPRRHPDGTLVDVGPHPMYLKVTSAGGGRPQRPYVTNDRRFATGVYCGGDAKDFCEGTAELRIGGRVIDTADFKIAKLDSGRIPMRLTPAAYRQLDGSASRTLRTTFVMKMKSGNFSFPLTLER